MRPALDLRAAILSAAFAALLIAIWYAATLPKGGAAALDPAYARLMGGGGQAAGFPGPAEVGRVLGQHLAHPFFNRGPNDKGIGLQLAYSLARVLVGFALAALV